MNKDKSLETLQLSQEHLSLLQNLLSQDIWNKELIMTQAFAWMNVAPVAFFYNWGCKDLSMSRDQKVMTLLPPMENCPMNFYQGVFITL